MTTLPVAILILFILGIVHLIWLTFTLTLIQYYLFPMDWVDAKSFANIVSSAAFTLVLSLPLAMFIEKLKPQRTAIYIIAALAPIVGWYLALLFTTELSPSENQYFLISMATITLSLLVAVYGIRSFRK